MPIVDVLVVIANVIHHLHAVLTKLLRIHCVGCVVGWLGKLLNFHSTCVLNGDECFWVLRIAAIFASRISIAALRSGLIGVADLTDLMTVEHNGFYI